MEQATRNKLRNVVTQCRKLLEESIAQQLEGQFGIRAGNKDAVQIEDEARMSHLSDEDQQYRHDLLDHLEHIKASSLKPKAALDQLIREIAFTHLNRLCAYKMMETRDVFVGGKRFREAVGRGINSNGFKFYLADHPDDEWLFNTGKQELAYRHFLDWLGGLLSEEIGVLFNPDDPANRLYPPQKTLDQVIALLNGEDIKPEEKELQDAWPKIWGDDGDDTIGWVYQFFTPKELRDKSRTETRSPRNSYELAFRNQFYTPRYVVKFLTDNTLGRIWYEMRKGDTSLKQQCDLMVCRPNEVFLDEDTSPPISVGNESSHVAHRQKKDPRELRCLDPACGSGHFLLYCFDVLQTIYEEAYSDIDLSPSLMRDFPDKDDFLRAIPGLILAHNLHGIDIDLRATQIAALALWLRCQRAFKERGLKKDRPLLSQSNLVCAEPMPGEKEILDEFTNGLEPKILRQLVEVVFDKMKLAGEAGSLLKIDSELREAIATAKLQWEKAPKQVQMSLFDTKVRKAQQKELPFDVSGITDQDFWDDAEAKALESLKDYAKQSSNGNSFQKKLFAHDAERGFSFIDICNQRFDVILMNPPFGACSSASEKYIEDTYENSKGDILATFVERMLGFTTEGGLVGAITSRTCFYLGTLTDFREQVLGKDGFVVCSADLGEGVLDATVETAMYVLQRQQPQQPECVFFRLLLEEDKASHLSSHVTTVQNGETNDKIFVISPTEFSELAGTPYCYWVSPDTIHTLGKLPRLEGTVGEVRVGLQTSGDFRFLRLIWEVPAESITPSPEVGIEESLPEACIKELNSGKTWAFYSKTDEARPWLSPLMLVVDWEASGERIKAFQIEKGDSPSRSVRSEDRYFQPGISYMLRSVRITPYIVPAGVIPTAGRSQVYPIKSQTGLLGVLSSNVASAAARFRGEWFARPKFQNSMIQELPVADIPASTAKKIESLIEDYISRSRVLFRNAEPFQEFCAPPNLSESAPNTEWELSSLLGDEIESEVAKAFGLSAAQYSELERDITEALSLGGKAGDDEDGASEEDAEASKTDAEKEKYNQLLSYCVGVVFGRWDVRFTTDPTLLPKSQKAFDRMPVCPPASLVGSNGLPAASGHIVSEEWLRARPSAVVLPDAKSLKGKDVIADDGYPVAVDWDGVLVDDEESADDIVRRVINVIEVMFKDKAEGVEKDACKTLGVKRLRDYFRKPGKGGFWQDHVGRYSVKRSRKAPIYWLLQSSKKNYGLWFYYHRLDKDMLFKALETNRYVDLKLQSEENRLDELRAKRSSAGDSGKEAKKLDRDIEKQEYLLAELRDFEEELRKVADLHLVPDLNDGVVLNIAPLHELVPWKEAKKYWKDLMDGKYEWSSIGKQLREKGLVQD